MSLTLLPRLRARLRKNGQIIEEAMGAENVQALQYAMAYAVQHAAGILEASDIIVPFSGECYSDADNFRADFLQTDTDDGNARERA